jgi:hypothetical protein
MSCHPDRLLSRRAHPSTGRPRSFVGATRTPAGNDAIPGVVTRGQTIPRTRPLTQTRPTDRRTTRSADGAALATSPTSIALEPNIVARDSCPTSCRSQPRNRKAPRSGQFDQADDGARTRDLRLGKPTLYQLSYVRDATILRRPRRWAAGRERRAIGAGAAPRPLPFSGHAPLPAPGNGRARGSRIGRPAGVRRGE